MRSEVPDSLVFQRFVTRVALAAIGHAGFVLAGSGAVREHGIIDRPTEDIDLFTDCTFADPILRWISIWASTGGSTNPLPWRSGRSSACPTPSGQGVGPLQSRRAARLP